MAATGGEPTLLTDRYSLPAELGLGNGELAQVDGRFSQAHMLPGSKTVLFQASRSADPTTAAIIAFDIATATQKMVLMDAMDPRYVQTGHLLFMRRGTLMAIGFDLERVEVHGEAVIILEDVMQSIFMPSLAADYGAAQVALSASGDLAYELGGGSPVKRETAVRVYSTGDTVALDIEPRDFTWFRVSPDGNRLAFSAGAAARNEIWVHDLRRGRGYTERVHDGGAMEWSPDGRFLAFSAIVGSAKRNIYSLPVDGSSEPERLAPSEGAQTMTSWSSEGVIAFVEPNVSGEGGFDIWMIPPDGAPAPFFTSADHEADATFSPDGRWLAYVSDRNGPRAVYVRPYPGPEPATLIVGGGAENPAWSSDGRQIYYIQASSDSVNSGRVLMAVDVIPGNEFQVGRPVALIAPWRLSVAYSRGYDVFPDGSFVTRVAEEDIVDRESLMAQRLEEFGATELHVVLNWAEELKERVPN